MPHGGAVRLAAGGALLGVAIVAIIAILGRRAMPETVITISALPPQQERAVTVYVGGAVARPGLYTLPSGERIEGAIAAAGGLTAEADPDGLNRALRLQDEAQIVVPRRGEPTATTTAPRSGMGALASPGPTVGTGTRGTPLAMPTGPINVNTATATELARLPGVGPKLAQEIIDYRTAYGPFAAAADLASVKGISERMVGEWKDLITIGR